MQFTQNVSSFNQVSAAAASGAVTRDKLVADDAWNLVGSVVTSSPRQNIYSTGEWGATGPWQAYYHNWQDAESRVQGWNMFMGDGKPQSSVGYKYANDGNDSEHRQIEWGQERRMGFYYKDRFQHDNDTGDYSGVTWRCMPVRNTTGASITRSISTSRSGGGGPYGGHATLMYTPNSGKKYSEVNSGTWTEENTTSSTSESNYNQSFNVTIPAYTTVLIMNTSGWWYHTTYDFKDSNMFYNLHDFFKEDNSLVCDLRMLDAMATIRMQGETVSSGNPWKLYPQCALKHGDR